MSDTLVRRSFLYFWQRYLNDTLAGPVLRLNQNSPVLSDARPGDELWAFAPVGGGRYAVVAALRQLSPHGPCRAPMAFCG